MKTKELEYWQVCIVSGPDSLSYSELLNFIVETPEQAIILARKWLADKCNTNMDVWHKGALIKKVERISPDGEFVDVEKINL